jgi:AcrR family transcriptional regulator
MERCATTVTFMAGNYHHGDLRHALLQAAAVAIDEGGPAALSLRDLARRAGVSHAAAAHHFGDKRGLITALATEGWGHFADELSDTLDATGDFVEVGVAYVRAAVTHRAHFEVMFRPDLYRDDDPDLVAAQERTAAVLERGLQTLGGAQIGPDPRTTATAAWSIVHGFATLWSNGLVIDQDDAELEPRARAVARTLFPNRPATTTSLSRSPGRRRPAPPR